MKRKTKKIMRRIAGFILLAALSFFLSQYISTLETEDSFDVTNHVGIMEVHFIDVGQGDAILIEADNSAMLIDAGENNKGSIVVDYLNSQNIKKLDYVIGTHPHSDHIGGLDKILSSFEIGKVILPSVIHTTKTFEDVLDTLEEHKLTITKSVVGDQYLLGSASFTIIAPNSDIYEDINNYSVGIKLNFGDTSFLMAGDAENLSENEIMENGIDITADVIKLGHHGSSFSSSKKFLNAVDPNYSILCVGKDNNYGHPHTETLQTIKDLNIKLYRTDVQGTVVFTSDGETISANTQDYQITEQDLEGIN